jgi:hypothetical protein
MNRLVTVLDGIIESEGAFQMHAGRKKIPGWEAADPHGAMGIEQGTRGTERVNDYETGAGSI